MEDNPTIKHLFHQSPLVYGVIFLVLVIIILVSYGGLYYYTQNITLMYTKEQLASTTEISQKNIQLLREALALKNNENASLYSSLGAEQERNNQFGVQVESLSSVVGQLYKLSKTDRELLQKYSNIYFLNENYTPSQLVEIDPTFLYRKNKTESIHLNIKPHLENMLKTASLDSISLLVLSAFRSFDTQTSLKTGYKVTYGTTSANKFSADQGYSEHQLGSTVDFTTAKGGEVLTGFEKTKSYEWLNQNAYKYGFILSYPKGNKFYQFEPWHWRFVGVELANKLHQDNKYFYSMDQREINDYLVKIFD